MEDIVFIGDWIKDRVLGSGSFGIVVLWKHKRTDEKLAIKTCKWGDELTAKHRARWTKEVEMMQNFNNPNIVGTKELPPEFIAGLAPANPSKLPILCMEYCSGGDLRQLLNKPEACAGLREIQVRQILSDIGNAVKFLHLNKITHRDLKPENIVLHIHDSAGGTAGNAQSQMKVTYKLIDLGYAKEIDSNSVCASFVGTLQYLAPELLYSKTYSNSVDYWSLGLLAFEIICGVRPFLQFMAPVQWIPHVKKKLHDHICVYEPFHEGDKIEYSTEIFPENRICKAFKLLIENWLRVALEWDPKLRGRDAPSKVTFNIPSEQRTSSNVIIFSLLDSILSVKIIKIFSIATLSQHSYEISPTTTISFLKSLIHRDTQIPVDEQVIISQATYVHIADDELVEKYWNEHANFMLFVFSKITLVNDNVEPIVPKTVQRCLAQPKQLYNYKNGQNLYRHGLYFVISQVEVYEGLINGLYTRAESLKNESKQLLLKHNSVDKSIGKLVAQQEIITKMVETGKKHIKELKETGTATNYLGGFQKVFDSADELSEKITKLQTAWEQLSTRLQSAARRSNEVLSSDLNGFVSKYNFHALFTNAVTCYVNYKRSEFHSDHRTKEKQCTDIMKICYDCLKLRSKIIAEMQDKQNNMIILKLKDLSLELAKIADIIVNATNNIVKLSAEANGVCEELAQCMWRTLSMLATAADQEAELPYSVVSFQKRDFKIGEPVSRNCIQTPNSLEEDEQIKSLVTESLKIRHSQMRLSQKLFEHKNMINSATFDFSFLNDN